jgi:hypothetical protein
MPYTANEGTEVAGGKYIVPPGVAVEELDGGKKKLSEKCPQDLEELLEKKGMKTVYDDLVKAIVKEGNTRSLFGDWKDKEFVSVIDLFADEFATKAIKVVLCKRVSNGMAGTQRWIEFIDTEIAPDYIPQYDASSRSGQAIKTMYNTLKFPEGVAVEELKQWNGRKQLKEKIPIYVEKLLREKDVMREYNDLVEACVKEGVGRRFNNWKMSKLLIIQEEFSPRFEAKGVAIFLSLKDEWVSHGKHGGHMEKFRWIEFVDREKQPNYTPQRDAETKEEKCIIS